MDRRILLGTGLVTFAAPEIGFSQPKKSKYIFSDVLVTPTVVEQRHNVFGGIKGTFSYNIVRTPALSTKSRRTLIAYGNGIGTTKGQFQCVELIKRFAQQLEFPAALGKGDANVTAQKFAEASGGGFSHHWNGASDKFPRIGSVISFEPWSTLPGHVGIVQWESSGIKDIGIVKLFDQNWPIGDWKTVEFKKINGYWHGSMLSNGSPVKVRSWAYPDK